MAKGSLITRCFLFSLRFLLVQDLQHFSGDVEAVGGQQYAGALPVLKDVVVPAALAHFIERLPQFRFQLKLNALRFCYQFFTQFLLFGHEGLLLLAQAFFFVGDLAGRQQALLDLLLYRPEFILQGSSLLVQPLAGFRLALFQRILLLSEIFILVEQSIRIDEDDIERCGRFGSRGATACMSPRR